MAASNAQFLTRHPDYYFDDGNLVILVEDMLFSVHRSTFTGHSRVFKDLFTLPVPSSGNPVEGSTDEHPIELHGISKTDFERLLWILYPPTFGEYKPTTTSEWTSVLHLATRWEFDSIRALALHSLEPLPLNPIDKVLLAREFDITSPWALAAYTELCERPEALTIPEARALGLETAMRISQLRERLRGGRKPVRRNSSPNPNIRGASPIASAHHGGTECACGSRGPNTGGAVSIKRTLGHVPRPSEASRLAAEAFGLDGK
ncbi:hypothetical protein PLICRDRAFT_96246 [Plicaturopsis crispa FD-325 SS-3]|nr:hypothetical protein PLICRDRAFT_96246 [Plicaturopsis crispa FD-325 SS-3]